MIKDIKFRITVDQRGKITTGEKSEKGYPKTLDHFNISKFDELLDIYGEKPSKLMLFFPTDNIEEFFDCDYVLYGSNKSKIRSCDGETCIHRIKETIGAKTYEAGEESECVCEDIKEEKKKCRYSAYLKAYIINKSTGFVVRPICYMFHTTSKNSGDAIYSELKKIKDINMGVLRNIPFGLGVKMVESKREAGKKFPIWYLQVLYNMEQLKNSNNTLEYKPVKQIEDKKQDKWREPDINNPLGID